MRAACLAVVALCAIAAPSTLVAQTQRGTDRIQYATSWTAGKALSRVGEEDLPPLGESKTVNRGELIMAAQLFPERVARLKSFVQDEKGKPLAAAGQEFFSLYSSSGRVFCSSKFKEPSAVSKLLLGGPETSHVCLVDEDSDDDFDFYFRTVSVIKGLPSISGRTSEKPKRIAAVAYDSAPGSEMEGFLFVALEYRGNANLYNQHVFETVFGNSEKRDSITQRITAKSDVAPSQITFLGGAFTLISGDNSTAVIRVDREIQRVPFGVSRTIEYRFY